MKAVYNIFHLLFKMEAIGIQNRIIQRNFEAATKKYWKEPVKLIFILTNRIAIPRP